MTEVGLSTSQAPSPDCSRESALDRAPTSESGQLTKLGGLGTSLEPQPPAAEPSDQAPEGALGEKRGVGVGEGRGQADFPPRDPHGTARHGQSKPRSPSASPGRLSRMVPDSGNTRCGARDRGTLSPES